MKHTVIGLSFRVVIVLMAFAIPTHAATDYTALRALSGGSGQIETVTNPDITGSFAWQASDPNGHGDDGGIVITASGGGYWVRQFAYDVNNPIELDWYQLVDNQAIDDLFKNIAQAYSPEFFVRMPSTPINLNWTGAGLYNWSTAEGITAFALFESDADTSISFTHPSTTQNWYWGDMSTMILGTMLSKAQDDYHFTVIGPWTPTNRVITDADGIASGAKMLEWRQDADTNVTGHFRFNSEFAVSCVLLLGANGDRMMYVAGRHRFGGCIRTTGSFNGRIHFDDAYFSDEMGRGVGWDGSSDGSFIPRQLGHWRGTYPNLVSNGNINSWDKQVTGKVTLQYGGGSMTTFFIDRFGTSISDPFTIVIKDYQWSGPNPYTNGDLWRPGVEFDRTTINQHPIKTDGMGEDRPNWRFIKIIEDNQWSANNRISSSPRIYFGENERCDDLPAPCTSSTISSEVVYTLVNAQGKFHWQNGQNTFDSIERNAYQGDGVNPAMIDTFNGSENVSIELTYLDTLRYGQFHDVRVADYLTGSPNPFGNDNTIIDVTLTGELDVNGGAGNTATNLTFIGSARQVITIDNGGSLAVTNLCAPAGSTVGGSGSLIVNGSNRSLPYTIQTSDCNESNPDIPDNPLIAPPVVPAAPTNLLVN